LSRVGYVKPVLFRKRDARQADVAIVDHKLDRSEPLALTRTDKAVAGIGIELRAMFAARDKFPSSSRNSPGCTSSREP
jgi:hypothetical protein